jgi:hypothetical protein
MNSQSLLKEDFSNAVIGSRHEVKNKLGPFGGVVHTAMVHFISVHQSDTVSKNDIADFCKKISSARLKSHLKQELSNIYDSFSP